MWHFLLSTDPAFECKFFYYLNALLHPNFQIRLLQKSATWFTGVLLENYLETFCRLHTFCGDDVFQLAHYRWHVRLFVEFKVFPFTILSDYSSSRSFEKNEIAKQLPQLLRLGPLYIWIVASPHQLFPSSSHKNIIPKHAHGSTKIAE